MKTDEDGKEYQDFISKLTGIPFYASRKYQLEEGESPSILGMEAKWNSKADTVGCWIEILEKRDKDNLHWVVTDWVLNDTTFFIIAGNFNMQWIFAKWILLKLALEKIWEEIKGGTSIGFCLKKDECDKWCIWKHGDTKTIQNHTQAFNKILTRLKDEYPDAKIFHKKVNNAQTLH